MLHPEAMYPTLYTPATKDPQKLLHYMEGNDALVRRFVICTEDAVSEHDVPGALQNLEQTLEAYEPTEEVTTFIRVRNQEIAEEALAMEGIEKLTGFVVPKADPSTYPTYAKLIAERSEDFRIMPILESPGMADREYRRDLLDVLQEPSHQQAIDCLRIGGNDLMNVLGMRRPKGDLTIYNTAVGQLINDIIIEYRGNGGFELAAPVYENYGAQHLSAMRRESEIHVANQLYGQVVLHPAQLQTLWDTYKVDVDDLQHAQYVRSAHPEAAIGQEGRLVSLNTHYKWAGYILERARLFGVADGEQTA